MGNSTFSVRRGGLVIGAITGVVLTLVALTPSGATAAFLAALASLT